MFNAPSLGRLKYFSSSKISSSQPYVKQSWRRQLDENWVSRKDCSKSHLIKYIMLYFPVHGYRFPWQGSSLAIDFWEFHAKYEIFHPMFRDWLFTYNYKGHHWSAQAWINKKPVQLPSNRLRPSSSHTCKGWHNGGALDKRHDMTELSATNSTILIRLQHLVYQASSDNHDLLADMLTKQISEYN